MLTRNRTDEERKELDDLILSRPGEVDPDTGLAPPTWWHGEDDAAAASGAFLRGMRR